ncbi:hypothetical protein WJX73_001100 [Symbiochloris irregularis]|uniref:DIRP domain-containing protein n=1 Tax=Symbiochloris irregularis TaxID=706552 RepID=A0AAW1NMW1_9CHLO
MPRGRRRKPLPEKIPPMMSPIKSLFGRRTTAGLMLGIPGHASGSLLSSLLLGPPSALSDAGSNMRPSELRLRRCLDARTRRWCMYEFFCSALDRPWLLACELREWLAHAGLPPDLRLTRAEWVAVRAALGRPRRLSLAFLHEERAKLEAWREEMRAKYEEVGCGNEVPPDVPRPLQVGQRVTARHPVTRQLHDGDILTTGHSLYRVQFDRRELGVELIKDVDVMPIDPTENLPASMLASAAAQGLQVNGRQVTLGVPIRRPRPQLPPAPPPVTRSPSELKADSVMASGEVDRKALIRHVEAALDRKEILIARLKAMNDVAETGRHIDSVTRKLLPSFEREYAQAILDLRNLNRDLERGLVVLEAGTPLVTRVASSLQRRTNIPSIDHALAAHEPTQAPSMKLAPMAGHVSRLTPEAAWAAAWIEAQSLVTSLQAAINRGDVTLGSRLQSSSGLAGAGGMQRPPPTAGNMRPAGAGAPPPPAAGLRPPSAGAPPAAQPQSGPAAAATGMPPMQSTAAPQPPYPQQHPHAAGSTVTSADPRMQAAAPAQPAPGAAGFAAEPLLGQPGLVKQESFPAASAPAPIPAHMSVAGPAAHMAAAQAPAPASGPPAVSMLNLMAPWQARSMGSPPQQPSPWVTRAVVACIAMVLSIHQSTEFGTPEAVTVSTLDRGMALLYPRSPANHAAFAESRLAISARTCLLLVCWCIVK